MALDLNYIGDSFNPTANNSGNTTNNTANVGFDLDNVGNTDDSTNDSGNLTVGVNDAFNSDSHDVETESTNIDVGSYNDNSDNSWTDTSDNSTTDNSNNSTNDSGNDNSDEFAAFSYNTFTDNSMNDDSVNAGLRSYNTGFGDLNLGGGHGGYGGHGGGHGGGDIDIDSASTIVDQSVNANIAADGWVELGGGSSAVVASGDGSMAAGNDIGIYQSVDNSTNIGAGEDVNIGNETTVNTVAYSNNSYEDNSSETDNSVDIDVDDSFNDLSDHYTANNSFNDELTSVNESDWDVDANVIWNSDVAAIVNDVDVDLDPGV